MTLRAILNAAWADLTDGMDEDAARRMDKILMGEAVPAVRAAAVTRAQHPQPRRGSPKREAPPPPPAGIPLAPVGVIVREPEPTRGLDALHAAFSLAPKPGNRG